jgi:hypothetical protein
LPTPSAEAPGGGHAWPTKPCRLRWQQLHHSGCLC